METSEFVTIKTFATAGEAMVYKSLLESAGIMSHIKNELMSMVMPVVNPSLSVELVVSEEDVARAREFLAAKIEK